MTLHDALYNWLQIKVVWEARPRDHSAEDTVKFFEHILSEDHGVKELSLSKEKDSYTVCYSHEGEDYTKSFDREQAEQLLISIESEPKYNQQFDSSPKS